MNLCARAAAYPSRGEYQYASSDLEEKAHTSDETHGSEAKPFEENAQDPCLRNTENRRGGGQQDLG